jgi:hypothetical protein
MSLSAATEFARPCEPPLFGPAPLRYRGYTAVRSVTPAGSVPLPRDGMETWGRGARFGLGPTSGERIIWYATWNAAAGGQHDGDTAARLRELFGAWHDPIPAIIDATPQTAVIRNDIYDRRPARTWSRGRVALAGDAIHPMTPDLAQGACQAIIDATTLASCLAGSRDTRAALREYQRRRWRNAATTTLIARNTGATGQWQGLITCAARCPDAGNAIVAAASPVRPHPRRRTAAKPTAQNIPLCTTQLTDTEAPEVNPIGRISRAGRSRDRNAAWRPFPSVSDLIPKLRPVRQGVLGLTWAFTGSAGWCSGYFKVSGIAVPMRWKACRWAVVGSVSIGMVTWVPVNRTWLRVKVARWSSRPRKPR